MQDTWNQYSSFVVQETTFLRDELKKYLDKNLSQLKIVNFTFACDWQNLLIPINWNLKTKNIQNTEITNISEAAYGLWCHAL